MKTLYCIVTHCDNQKYPGYSWYPTKAEAVRQLNDWEGFRPNMMSAEIVKADFPNMTKEELYLAAAGAGISPEETKVVKQWKRKT